MTKKSWFTIITTVLIMALAVFAGMYSVAPPKVTSADASPTEFSAERAMKHISAIAQEPHPVGSLANEQVLYYIVAQLEAMGLNPEVQQATAVVTGRHIGAGSVSNVIVKIPGTNPSRSIVLDGHYDSVPTTPGAADDASAVATLLETARALKAGPRLANDVILIFADSEEFGTRLGTIAFVEQHPLASEIGVVLDFEGIGRTGPSIMFETGPSSGWLIRDFGRVTSLPVAQSWVEIIWKMTPYDTDLTVYSKGGIPGLDFANMAEGMVYHTMLDKPQTYDPRSLQHEGDYALALVNHLGGLDLTDIQNSDSGATVYFTAFRGWLVSYPAVWAIIIAVLTGVFLIGITLVGLRRNQITVRGTAIGLAAFFISLITAAGLTAGIWMLISGIREEYQVMAIFGRVYDAELYLFAFIALAVAIVAAMLILFRRRARITELTLGALLFWWLLALMSSIMAPGFSYLFTWPLVFSALALGWVLWKESLGEYSLRYIVVSSIGVLPGIIIMVSYIYVMFHFAPTYLMGVTIFMVALFLGLLIPQIDLITRTRKWWLPGAAIMVFIVFILVGNLTASFTTEQPRHNAVAYMLNTDTGQATWFSPGRQTDIWTSQFLSAEPEPGYLGELFPLTQRSRLPIVKNEAPVIPLDEPEVEILDDQIVNGVRTLRLHLSSPRQAPVITLDVKPYAVVKGVMVDGQRTDNPEEGRSGLWSLVYYAVPSKGVDITLEVEPGQEFTIQITDQSLELPSIPGTTFKPRSDDMIPTPNFYYGTVVVRTLTIR